MTRRRAPWLLAIVLAVAGMGGLMIPRGVTAQPKLQGTILPASPAPAFRLTDQFGHGITLSQFHGHPVLVTFVWSHCTQLCPVIAETIRRSLAEMGPAARRVDVVAVTTDPEEDTPAAARWFSSQHGLLHRWHYLLGTRAQLAPIWHAYYIYAAPPNAPASVKDAHTGATYLIDTQGRERVLMGGAPDTATLVRDLQILSGLMPNSTGESAVPAPQGGHPAPDFTLPALDGSAVHLSGLRNRVVLLNFWATWCTPCRSEMPMLANWYRQLHGQHFVILGVDQQQSAAQARSFAQKYHIPYPILLDQSGAISAQYDVVGLPTSLLIDRNGVVESVKAGILNKSYLSIVVQPFLRGHPGER